MKAIKLVQDKVWQPSDKPIRIEVPGSKSITNRALIAASIDERSITIVNPSLSADSLTLKNALSEIGINISTNDEASWVVENSIRNLSPKKITIDCGPAGTTARFLLAFVAFLPGFEITITGSERLRDRPMGILIEALNSLGAQVKPLGELGKLPVVVTGVEAPIARKRIEVDASVSSQFITALQLIMPIFESGIEVVEINEPVSSAYSELTRTVQNQLKLSDEIVVEADAAAAGYMWSFGVLRKQPVQVPHTSLNSTQGDIEFVKALEVMGAEVSETIDGIVITPTNQIKAFDYNMINCSDTAQTASILATQASGESYLSGLSTLPAKETDRLTAVKNELAKVGIIAEIDGASIRIFPGDIDSASIETYHDHRMAMSFSLLAAVADNLIIEDPAVVEKSFPDFWSKLKYFGITAEEVL